MSLLFILLNKNTANNVGNIKSIPSRSKDIPTKSNNKNFCRIWVYRIKVQNGKLMLYTHFKLLDVRYRRLPR